MDVVSVENNYAWGEMDVAYMENNYVWGEMDVVNMENNYVWGEMDVENNYVWRQTWQNKTCCTESLEFLAYSQCSFQEEFQSYNLRSIRFIVL